MSHQEAFLQLQVTNVCAWCAWSQEGRAFGQGEGRCRLGPQIKIVKDLAWLCTANLPAARQREGASQMLRSSLRCEVTSTVKTETPFYRPPAEEGH